MYRFHNMLLVWKMSRNWRVTTNQSCAHKWVQNIRLYCLAGAKSPQYRGTSLGKSIPSIYPSIPLWLLTSHLSDAGMRKSVIAPSKGTILAIRDVKFWAWTSNYIQCKTMLVITYPCPNLISTMLVKWVLVYKRLISWYNIPLLRCRSFVFS